MYKGVGGWEAESGLHHPLGHRQWCCVFSKEQIQVQSTGYTEVVVSSRLAPPTFLINAIQRPHRLFSAPLWFYRVGKKPSVKADLAIFSHVLGTSGQC